MATGRRINAIDDADPEAQRITEILLGPWSWLISAYIHEEARDAVTIVAFCDARSASGARSS